MRTLLRLPPGCLEEVLRHLMPPMSSQEQAAFLFVSATTTGDQLRLDFIEFSKLDSTAFDWQESDYLELSDLTKQALIKRAHSLNAALIEMHSHPGPWQAEFSPADRIGLRDTVRHMRWRLPDRPYAAIVTAKSGFDALVWSAQAKAPSALDAILDGSTLRRPTNRSLEGWNGR